MWESSGYDCLLGQTTESVLCRTSLRVCVRTCARMCTCVCLGKRGMWVEKPLQEVRHNPSLSFFWVFALV